MKLDIDYVRGRFPSLKTEWALMDNAGGSQTLDSVIARINDYLLSSNVQHGASYDLSQLAMSRMDEASEAMARYINAADASEIVFGPCSTMLTRGLASSLLQTLKPGDEIVVTGFDHEANIGPWIDFENHGIAVKFWELNPSTFEIDVDGFRSMLNEKTKLVAFTHVSNLLGAIHPIKKLVKIAHEFGALTFADGVAYAPHRRVDVRDWDIDFYVFSLYKVFGVHYSLMYGKRDLLLKLPGINHYFIDEDDIPYKFQPGSPNYELSYSALGITDYITDLARHHGIATDDSLALTTIKSVFELIELHEEVLSARLLDFLKSKSKVRIYGPAMADRNVRVPTISFSVEGMTSESITLETNKHKVAIRYGHFYSRRLSDRFGLPPEDGVVRASMVHYNTLEEVDRLIAALDSLF